MKYLDTNLFVTAGIDQGPAGEQAAALLRTSLAQGACTAALTMDEALWSMSKHIGRTEARNRVKQLLAADLQILPVDRDDVVAALEHHAAGFDPRDAIHAAVALRHKCTAIVSSDSSFRKLKGIKHIPF